MASEAVEQLLGVFWHEDPEWSSRQLMTLAGALAPAIEAGPHRSEAWRVAADRAFEQLQLHSVEDADRIGRPDLVRCFLLDTSAEPWCYREQVGGHDRFPEITAPEQVTEMRRDFASDPELGKRHLEVYTLFPEGEITALRAVVLAWLERDVRVDWSLEGLEFAAAILAGGERSIAVDCARVLERVGYLVRTPRHAWDYSGALAAMPRLYARLQELRAAKASPAAQARP